MENSACLTKYTYNQRDQLIKVTKKFEGREYITEYGYDAVGNCTGIRGPFTDSWLEYTYDTMHRLSEVAGYAQFSYYKTGHQHKTFYYSGLVTETTRDNRNRPIRIHTSNEILDLTYSFDGEGNILGINQDTFTYDALNRLTGASLEDKSVISVGEQKQWIQESFGSYKEAAGYQDRADINRNGCVDGVDLLLIAYGYRPPVKVISFEYDSLGNRTKCVGERNSTYSYDVCDRLISEIREGETIDYQYDENGNLTGRMSLTETMSYVYNFENRLIKVFREENKVSEYNYDGDGKRIKKVVFKEDGIKTTIYHYDQWGQVICESDETGVVLSRYVFAHSRQLSKEDEKGKIFYHHDHLGSARVMTDESGNKIWWKDYYPFGDKFAGENLGSTTSYQFTGKEKDEETGLFYYGARYYDPSIGRFITEDLAEPDWDDRGYDNFIEKLR